MGYLLALPLRRLVQNPARVLGACVTPGMAVADIGCAMGYFSLPLARRVGPRGRVVCVDRQPGMLRALERRAARAGLRERIETRACEAETLGLSDLTGQIGFALAFAVVHEAPDAGRFLGEIASILKPGGLLLVAEPRAHVSGEAFGATIEAAERAGLRIESRPSIPASRSALFRRP